MDCNIHVSSKSHNRMEFGSDCVLSAKSPSIGPQPIPSWIGLGMEPGTEGRQEGTDGRFKHADTALSPPPPGLIPHSWLPSQGLGPAHSAYCPAPFACVY